MPSSPLTIAALREHLTTILPNIEMMGVTYLRGYARMRAALAESDDLAFLAAVAECEPIFEAWWRTREQEPRHQKEDQEVQEDQEPRQMRRLTVITIGRGTAAEAQQRPAQSLEAVCARRRTRPVDLRRVATAITCAVAPVAPMAPRQSPPLVPPRRRAVAVMLPDAGQRFWVLRLRFRPLRSLRRSGGRRPCCLGERHKLIHALSDALPFFRRQI